MSSVTTLKVVGSAVKSHEPERVIVKAQISKKLGKNANGEAESSEETDLAGPVAPASERIAAILEPLANDSDDKEANKSLVTQLIIGQPYVHTQQARSHGNGNGNGTGGAFNRKKSAARIGVSIPAVNQVGHEDSRTIVESDQKDDKNEVNDSDEANVTVPIVGGKVTLHSRVDIEAEFLPRNSQEWLKIESVVRELSSTPNVSIKTVIFTINEETAATMIRQARIEAVENAKEEALHFALGLGFTQVECLTMRHAFGPTAGISTLRPQQSRNLIRPRSVSVSVKVDADFMAVPSPSAVTAGVVTPSKEEDVNKPEQPVDGTH